MTIKIFVPRNSAAVACGADEVANAVDAAATKTKARAEIAGNGSRTMLWLEPLLEIEDWRALRLRSDDESGCWRDRFVTGQDGSFENQASSRPGPDGRDPLLQEADATHLCALRFDRSGFTRRRQGARRLKGLERALAIKPIEIVEEVSKSGLRGCGGAGLAIPVLTKRGPCYAISLP